MSTPQNQISPQDTRDFLPSVSIIIPVYNGMRTMKTCLDAIMKLDYPADKVEVIVIDNNSRDGTPELVQQYPVKLVFEREIQGPHAATNTGVRVASGDILAFTDSDCVPDVQWLRKLMQPFSDDNVVCAGGSIVAYQPNSRVERFIDKMQVGRNGIQPNERFPKSFITANAACRRDAFNAVGMLNPNMYTGAEVNLFYQVQLQTGKRGVYVHDAQIAHMFNSTIRSMSRHQYIYGYGEILLATIYRDYPNYPWTPKAEARIILRQIGALFTYTASFIFRSLTYPFRRKVDSDYLWWPILWLIVESSNLRGKFEGLWVTRFLRYKFWEHKVRVI